MKEKKKRLFHTLPLAEQSKCKKCVTRTGALACGMGGVGVGVLGGVVRWMSWDQLASVVELGISALWFWPKFR